jgi:hypothetical protein
MKQIQIIRGYVFFGIFLLAILAFWAAGWWSWKLIITVPVATIAYYCISCGVGCGTLLVLEEKTSFTVPK